jgi:hypothetical protein
MESETVAIQDIKFLITGRIGVHVTGPVPATHEIDSGTNNVIDRQIAKTHKQSSRGSVKR